MFDSIKESIFSAMALVEQSRPSHVQYFSVLVKQSKTKIESLELCHEGGTVVP